MEEALHGVILLSVLGKTDAIACARAGCVSRRWCQTYSDEELWRSFCVRDFSVSAMVDPLGNPCQSYKETYKVWCTTFQDYPKPLVARANRCWSQLREWLKLNYVEVHNSLLSGASLMEIREAERQLGFELPAPVRLMYQMCNGQALPDDEFYDENEDPVSKYVGLLGGYQFYKHFVNVHLLPLQQLVKLTLAIVPGFGLCSDSRRVVIAASCNSMKVFFLDCFSGQIYVGTGNFKTNGEMMPCTPDQGGGGELKDGMLRWLENYTLNLRTGMYSVRVENGIRAICLYPLKEPLCTTAVTRGLQVQTSAVFVPEQSAPNESHHSPYYFSYSVRMRLLPPSIRDADSSVEAAQLLGRHWVIRPDGFPPDQVTGEAVIGQYPYLKAGGEEFVYQSCSALQSKSGTMEGDFTFVPGWITKPNGAQFIAYAASFPLRVPDYIF